MNTHAALYQRLMVQHHATKSELQKLQEQLQASQGTSFFRRGRLIVVSTRDLSLLRHCPYFYFIFAAVAREQSTVNELTARIGEV